MGQHLAEAMTFIFLTAVTLTVAAPILATLTLHQMGMVMKTLKLEVS